MRTLSLVLSLPLLAVAVLTGRLLRRYRVDGESMLPTYRPGDRVLAEALTYRLRAPRPSEVVVVVQPGTDGRKDLKRIAAAPGATVSVNGAPYVLGDDEWYVLGDNLDGSTDSRTLGPLKRGDILAKVWRRY
jgi:signal peptidase I